MSRTAEEVPMPPGEGSESGDGEAEVMLATALAQAVREAGPQVAGDSRRVRGMVSDILGASSPAHRHELHAVVLAAEDGIPDELISGHLDTEGAVQRLVERGSGDAVARSAVEDWRYALGMTKAGAMPSSPAATTTVAPATTTLAPATGHAAATHRRSARRLVVPVAAALLVSAIVVAIWRDKPPATQATPTTVRSTPTTVFPVESTTLGALTRTWRLEDGVLLSSLAFDNPSTVDLTGRYYEVVPKDLTTTAAGIVSQPVHAVIEDDPVIAWDLVVPAGAAYEVTYRIDVDDGATQNDLDRWRGLQLTEAAARFPQPALTVTTPDGLVVTDREVVITGTADPAATVIVNAVTATVAADGNWSQHLFLDPGANPITVTAENSFGRKTLPTSLTVVATTSNTPTTVLVPTSTTARRPSPPTTTTTTTTPAGASTTAGVATTTTRPAGTEPPTSTVPCVATTVGPTVTGATGPPSC